MKPATLKSLSDHPAHRYAGDVVAGRVVACRWVKLACERYFFDRRHQKIKGFVFDRQAAETAVSFYELCHHFKGEWSGTQIALEPWQQFVVWNVFGWVWADSGLRRFRTVYETVARKNGKTTKVAPVGLFMLWRRGDCEPGAEVYSVAHDKKQAREVFDAARVIAMTGPLAAELEVLAHNINDTAAYSKFEPLTADHDSHHGKNIHCALCDELHVWPKRDLWNVLQTGTGSRRQPLMWAITTAGSDQNSICYDLHEYTQRVLKGFEGGFVDDSFFGIIYTLDRKSDWPELQTKEEHNDNPSGAVEDDIFDPAVWIKANPNLGVSVKLDDIESLAKRARAIPADINDFMRLKCNIWTQQVTRWLSLEDWDANFTREIYCHGD